MGRLFSLIHRIHLKKTIPYFVHKSTPNPLSFSSLTAFQKNLSFLDTLCIYPTVQHPSFPPLQMFGYTLCLLPQTVTKYLRFLVCLVFLSSSESKQGKKNMRGGETPINLPVVTHQAEPEKKKIPFLTPFLPHHWGKSANLQPFVGPYSKNVLEKCRLIPCTASFCRGNLQLPPERD